MTPPVSTNTISHTSTHTNTSPASSSQTGNTTQHRIRTPHEHDVLCGRGGGINSHVGNKKFRDWVRERKQDYNLACSKVAKAKVSRDVINRVSGQDPPGRFLQREDAHSSSYWVEIDDVKIMAKTSQALREGAPAIRAKVKSDKDEAVTSSVTSQDKSNTSHEASTKLEPDPNTNTALTNQDKSHQADDSETSTVADLMRKTRPRSESIKRIIEYENPHHRQKLSSSPEAVPIAKPVAHHISVTPLDETQTQQIDMTHTADNQTDKSALKPSAALLSSLSMIPTAPQANNLDNIDLKTDTDLDTEFNRTVDSTRSLLKLLNSSNPLLFGLLSDRYSPPLSPSPLKSTLTRTHSLDLSELPGPDSISQSYLYTKQMLSGENDQITINDRFFDDDVGDEEEDFFDIESLMEGNPEEYSGVIMPVSGKRLKNNIESKPKALMRGWMKGGLRSLALSQLVSSDTKNVSTVSSDTDSESSREKKASTVSSDTDSES